MEKAKGLRILLLILLVSTMVFIKADEQLAQICGGDNELQVICFGDSENAPIGLLPVITPPGGGPSGGPSPEIPEDLISLIEEKPAYFGFFFISFFIILIVLLWWFIIWKRKKDKDKKNKNKEENS